MHTCHDKQLGESKFFFQSLPARGAKNLDCPSFMGRTPRRDPCWRVHWVTYRDTSDTLDTLDTFYFCIFRDFSKRGQSKFWGRTRGPDPWERVDLIASADASYTSYTLDTFYFCSSRDFSKRGLSRFSIPFGDPRDDRFGCVAARV